MSDTFVKLSTVPFDLLTKQLLQFEISRALVQSIEDQTLWTKHQAAEYNATIIIPALNEMLAHEVNPIKIDWGPCEMNGVHFCFPAWIAVEVTKISINMLTSVASILVQSLNGINSQTFCCMPRLKRFFVFSLSLDFDCLFSTIGRTAVIFLDYMISPYSDIRIFNLNRFNVRWNSVLIKMEPKDLPSADLNKV